MKKKNLGYYILILIMGAVLGSFIGSLAIYLPPGAFRSAMLKSLTFSLGPGVLDLKVISITLGFGLNVNIVGVLGIIIIAYIFRLME
ncbi:MAG: DUF4321 domain-containing protein [Calditrichaeota bacterium]|nr:DUF4321 domain-containing protein [Calditrichota bacterium]MCB0304390.1 DUF4321 domain-containing protein [Calditrichota bacterium]